MSPPKAGDAIEVLLERILIRDNFTIRQEWIPATVISVRESMFDASIHEPFIFGTYTFDSRNWRPCR